MNPTQPVPVGRTGVTVTRLGLEPAPIGGLYRVGRRLVPASYQEVVDSVGGPVPHRPAPGAARSRALLVLREFGRAVGELHRQLGFTAQPSPLHHTPLAAPSRQTTLGAVAT